jgi:pimeloyl-ACP methyl ester carboxylesterase/predicted glycosyltransferase
VRVHWERFGDGPRTVLFVPTWSVVHSRSWKLQVAFFARHYRVLTFDGRGNGLTDRPTESSAYAEAEFAADALAVLDATGTDRAAVVSNSLGSQRSLLLAAAHPERVDALVFIGPSAPLDEPVNAGTFEDVRESYEGWQKYNAEYWRRDWPGFLQWFFGEACFTEPHSTKQIEDCVRWGLDTTGETLVTAQYGARIPNREAALELCARIRCPVLVIHGDEDAVSPQERGRRLAEATRGTFVPLPGGHLPHARDPVGVNLLLDEFIAGRQRTPARTATRRVPRILAVTSPIGLGHAQRDLAIVRELRKLRPGLEVDWLAQHPVTAVLEAAGERVHPASRQLANEAASFESHAREHELHAFQAWRELDEVFVANFMLFDEVARDGAYDLWYGDEAWEVDYFLHENPERKIAPYVFVTDFVGWLPVDEDDEHLTSDYNAENIGHVEGNPTLRDRAIFVGEQGDLVPRPFGKDLPAIDEWVPRHFAFSGYVLPSPADPAPRPENGPPLIVAAVGGSTTGIHLLRRIAAAFAELRRDTDAELLLVCGPRIDPQAIEPVPGMRAVGYVHDLHRTFASCDLAVVQGGLTTTMELVAARRPFVSVPLRRHFEQNGHVAHRLRRYGAPEPTPYEDTSPAKLAALMRSRLGGPVDYRPVERGGAARAAALIEPLLS